MKNVIDFIGMLAGVLAVVSFLPQAIKAYRTKSTNDISGPMFLLLILVALLWIVYGIFYQIPSLYISNALIVSIEIIIIILKFRFDK